MTGFSLPTGKGVFAVAAVATRLLIVGGNYESFLVHADFDTADFRKFERAAQD
jgi:hypothetical protein